MPKIARIIDFYFLSIRGVKGIGAKNDCSVNFGVKIAFLEQVIKLKNKIKVIK